MNRLRVSFLLAAGVRDPMNRHFTRELSPESNAERAGDLEPTRGALQTAGALALGAAAVGALAIGALAIGRLAIGRARIRRLEIDELIVRRLRVIEALDAPPQTGSED